jgi:hypothetical protein
MTIGAISPGAMLNDGSEDYFIYFFKNYFFLKNNKITHEISFLAQ